MAKLLSKDESTYILVDSSKQTHLKVAVLQACKPIGKVSRALAELVEILS